MSQAVYSRRCRDRCSMNKSAVASAAVVKTGRLDRPVEKGLSATSGAPSQSGTARSGDMKQRSPANRLAAAQALWTSWEAEVLTNGSTVSPLEVEGASQSEGHPWRYWRVTIDDQTAFEGSRWSWDVACAWIASRQQPHALEGIAAFRKWRGRVWRDLVGRSIEGRTWRIAEAELRNALAGGEVEAKAIRDGEAVVIPPDEWPGLEWEKDESGEALEFDHLQMMGERRYRRVTVSRANIMRVWMSLDSWTPEVADGVVVETPASAEEPVDVEFEEVATPGTPEVSTLAMLGMTNLPTEGKAVNVADTEPPQAHEASDILERRRRQTEAAGRAKVEQQTRRRDFVRQFDAEQGGAASARQAQVAVRRRFGDTLPSGRSTIAEDLAVIRGEAGQKI